MHVLEIDRSYPVPIEALWQAFTRPERLRAWWGPEGFRVVEIDFAPVVGRAYRVTLSDPEGERYTHEGTFVAVDPPERLSYTWRWTQGPLAQVDTLVVLTFTSEDTGSRVQVRHERFPSAEERDRHHGWVEGLERLARWLRGRSTRSPA